MLMFYLFKMKFLLKSASLPLTDETVKNACLHVSVAVSATFLPLPST